MLDHVNILKLYNTIETEDSFYMITEYGFVGDISKIIGRLAHDSKRREFCWFMLAVAPDTINIKTINPSNT